MEIQINFEGLFIDFVEQKEDGFTKAVDLKLSLLSSGNSYDTTPLDNLDDYRSYLLPWNWTTSDHVPTHIRIWRLDMDPAETIDIAINDVIADGAEVDSDLKKIKDYHLESLKCQIDVPEELQFDFNNNNAINIVVDDSGNAGNRAGMSHSVIAQMAQTLFPYNQNLQLLYISDSRLTKPVDIAFFTENVADNTSFICFPVSQDPPSIWYSTDTPQSGNGTWRLQYANERNLEGSVLTAKAITTSVKLPEYNLTVGNVLLTEKGRYVGRVNVEVAQDNDWQTGFVDILGHLLDITDLFLAKENLPILTEAVKDENEIEKIISYFLDPILRLPQYSEVIAELYHKTTIGKSKDINDKIKLDQVVKKSIEDFDIYKGRLDSFKDENKAVKAIILNLFYRKDKKEVPIDVFDKKIYKDDGTRLLEMLNLLYYKLSDANNQNILISVLLRFSFKTLNDNDYNIFWDGEKITLTTKDASRNLGVEQSELIPIQNLDLYMISNKYILSKAIAVGNQSRMLGYLLDGVDNFEVNHLTSISKKIEAIYTDSTLRIDLLDEFKFKTIPGSRIAQWIDGELEKFEIGRVDCSDVQLPIRIQIGRPSDFAPPEINGGLTSKLSGYVLLGTRGTLINDNSNFENWKYHNWVKAKLITEGCLPSPVVTNLSSSFLFPSNLQVQNGKQDIFLEISNEKASLSGLIDGLNEDVALDAPEGEKAAARIDYFLEDPAISIKQNPYGLKYGFYYKYSAFAILNSGILPEVIRKSPADINQFADEIPAGTIESENIYHYLRTIKINPPQVDHLAKPYPESLHPLFYELPISKDMDPEHKKLIVLGENFNTQFSFNVEKSRTSFWDCYSFTNDYPNFKHTEIIDGTETENYIDPCLSDYFYIEITEQNRIRGEEMPDISQIFTYSQKSAKGLSLKETLTVRFEKETAMPERISGKTIYLKPGKIYQLDVYNLVEQKYFGKPATVAGNTRDVRFHGCFDEFLNAENEIQGDKFIKLSPNTYFFETAISLSDELDPIIASENLWKQIEFKEEPIGFVADNNALKVMINVDDPVRYSTYSKVKVMHQKLEWNGRQPNIQMGDLLTSLNPATKKGDAYEVTEGMKLEAWLQSERFDHTSPQTEGRLMASGAGHSNLVHQYKAIMPNHAMYFKHTVEIFNRYHLLQGVYAMDSIKSKIRVENEWNQWKRHLKKSRRTESLSSVAIRFWFPLTNSITDATNGASDVADVMLVLDEVWYREAGFAEKLKVGIKTAAFEHLTYVEGGADVSFNKMVTEPYEDETENGFVTVDDEYIKGPLGFTFDFNATNPKIRSTSFIISGAGLSKFISKDASSKKNLYPMFNLAARREITPTLHEDYYECKCRKENPSDKIICNCGSEERAKSIYDLRSKWSNTTWVQFLKIIDKFVPDPWKKAVKREGYLELQENLDQSVFTLKEMEMQDDMDFNQKHNWYLIFSSTESDIGGLPCERYYDTFLVEANGLRSVHAKKQSFDFVDGNVRIMVVSKSKDFISDNVWAEMFGENDDNMLVNKRIVVDDNKIALPQITNKIPVKIKN